jgi:exosortase A-associated hydrolase 1
MNFSDVPLTIHCAGDTLMGIVSQPEQAGVLGMVIVVGGQQYRAGSHRQFVLLARYLASSGYPVLRFDHRGIGDSSGDRRCFDDITEDIDAAVLALEKTCPTVKQVVLWGLCDGASAALLYSGQRHDALAGLCLLNPWVRSEVTLARTHIKHYYPRRLLESSFWKRLWQGQYDWRPSMLALWQSLWSLRSGLFLAMTETPFQQKMATAMRHFPGQILLVLSECDYTAKEFVECAKSSPDWHDLLHRPTLHQVEVADADHTFSNAQWREVVEKEVLNWMRKLEGTLR